MLDAQAIAPAGELLSEEAIRETLQNGLGGRFTHARLLVLIPDHTRTLPLPKLFRLLVEVLHDAQQLDFMVALGTHPALSEESLCDLVGISAEERSGRCGHIGILNHAWDQDDALVQVGTIEDDQIQEIAGAAWHPSLAGAVPVRLNRCALEYDRILILGPSFPHEVVGISGGAKYLFPGISGPEMINKTHWLGALITTMKIIGFKHTPVRAMIHAAAALVPTPLTLIALTVEHGELGGMFIGDHLTAFEAAADLSRQRHIVWVDKPYQRVLSWAQTRYDELWTGAKAMYKLEPAVADGGELIIYAPHLDTVSHVHGRYIYEAGYHVIDYFLDQWEQFKHIPTGVLAHSTHVKGIGTFEHGVENPRIQVALASKISAEDCARLNLGYYDPAKIDLTAWQNGHEDWLFVPKAGETLYRTRE